MHYNLKPTGRRAAGRTALTTYQSITSLPIRYSTRYFRLRSTLHMDYHLFGKSLYCAGDEDMAGQRACLVNYHFKSTVCQPYTKILTLILASMTLAFWLTAVPSVLWAQQTRYILFTGGVSNVPIPQNLTGLSWSFQLLANPSGVARKIKMQWIWIIDLVFFVVGKS